MYDEMTRQQDHYWASLTYAQEEGIRQGIEQGIERGIGLGIEKGRAAGREEGIEQGRISVIVNLVKEEIITKEMGAQKLNLSEKEFEGYL